MVAKKISRNYACSTCEGNIVEAVEQGDMLCNVLRIVRELTILAKS